MTLFILSLQRVVLGTFPIIAPIEALPIWEAKFLHRPPSANVVVYKANQDVWRSIRSLEFYNEVGSTMSEVLLSSSNIVVEVLFFIFSMSKIISICDGLKTLETFF